MDILLRCSSVMLLVSALTESGQGNRQFTRDFFREEYTLDYLTSKL